MEYVILLVIIVILSIFLKIKSNYLFLLAGLLIIFHPILLAKQQAAFAYQISIFVFLLFLAALIILALKNLLRLKIDEKDSFVIIFLKNNITTTVFNLKYYVVHNKYLAILLTLIFILLFWKASPTLTILYVIFLLFLLNKWDSRITIFLAMVCVAFCPFLIILKKESLAENFAIFAYYFFLFTVLLQIFEFKRKKNN